MNANNHAHLGCCGYDDLGYKPPTTSPMSSAKRRTPVQNIQTDPNYVRPILTMNGNVNGARHQMGRPLLVGNMRLW